MPASRITLPQRSISLDSSWPSASGVLLAASTPCPAIFWRTSARASAATDSRLSRSITARGVPAGANRPNQEVTSKSRRPDSMTVGTSGISLLRWRPVMAMARSLPDFTCWITEGMVEKYSCTWPPSRSVTAGPPPL